MRNPTSKSYFKLLNQFLNPNLTTNESGGDGKFISLVLQLVVYVFTISAIFGIKGATNYNYRPVFSQNDNPDTFCPLEARYFKLRRFGAPREISGRYVKFGLKIHRFFDQNRGFLCVFDNTHNLFGNFFCLFWFVAGFSACGYFSNNLWFCKYFFNCLTHYERRA